MAMGRALAKAGKGVTEGELVQRGGGELPGPIAGELKEAEE
jgi:hypothetical protein